MVSTYKENLQERTIMFTFDFTTVARRLMLKDLLATFKQSIYSTHAKIVWSEDRKKAKIVLLCNTVQSNNVDAFLREVPGVKSIGEGDPVDEIVALINQYHHNMWNELDFPHEEMRISALANGIAMRRSILDYPTFRNQKDVWSLADECYEAFERTGFFENLASHRKMVRYSFTSGYVAEQGCTEMDTPEGTARFKAEVLVMEERGRPDILIHTFVQQIRNRLIKTGYRNTMELLENTLR